MSRLAATLVLFLYLGVSSCSGSGGTGQTGPDVTTFADPWPADLGAVLATVFTDGRGDQEALPPAMAGPPYSGPVDFPPVDVTEVAVGIDGDFLYMRVRYAGIIPAIVVHVPANGEVEEQWAMNQGMNIALNTDGNQATGGGGEGVSGIDIFFAVSFEYGQRHQVYAN